MSLKNKLVIFFVATLFVAMFLDAQSRALQDYVTHFNDKLPQKEAFSFTGCYDTGDKGIEEISLYYSSDQPQTLPMAREEFVQFITGFLKGLNQNLKLKGQLDPYPFTSKNLDVAIFYRQKNGKYATSPNIGQISMKGGVITYYKYASGQFEVIKQENFNTAYRSINN